MIPRIDAGTVGSDRERDGVRSVARGVRELDDHACRRCVIVQGDGTGVLQRVVEFLEPLGREEVRHELGRGLHGGFAGRFLGASTDLSTQPRDRVVVGVDDALLQRDDGVIGDVDVLGTDLGAALGDVAVAETHLLFQEFATVVGIEGVHLELGVANEETRPGVVRLVLFVVPDDVADVLAQEALDALAELLSAIDVLLEHAISAFGHRRREECRHALGHLKVERDVGHEVTDDGEGLHRRYGHLALGQLVHSRHAHETRFAVDLGGARAALAGLAVPSTGEVRCLGGLNTVDDVEDHFALVLGDRVGLEVAPGSVAAPDSHRHVGHQCASSSRAFSSSGIGSNGDSAAVIGLSQPPPSHDSAKLNFANSGSGLGKSSRGGPPRDSLRRLAASAVERETVSIDGRSVARFHPGLYARPPLTEMFLTRSMNSSSLPLASSNSGPVRMMPTSDCIISWRSCWIVYGFSPSARSKGASASLTAVSASSISNDVATSPASMYSAAPMPARRPKTTRSLKELPPRRSGAG